MKSYNPEIWTALLKGVAFFDMLNDDDIIELLEAGTVTRYGFHEYIIRERDEDRKFFVVLKGKVKLIKEDEEKRKKDLWYLDKGDCFGEIGLLLDTFRSATILAGDECYIFEINNNAIETLPQPTKSKIYKRICISLAEKLRSTTEYVVNPTLL